MPTLGFSHYNLRAPLALVEELCRFYCDIVGLAVGPRPPFTSKGYWLYAGNQDVLHLSEVRPGEARDTRTRTTFDHAAFRCAGRAGYEQKLQDAGIDFKRSQVPAAGLVQLFFQDPAGNGVELNFTDDAST